jgi:hypothetical protein
MIVNLFGGLWCEDLFFDRQEDKQFERLIKKKQSLKAERPTAFKRQDVLLAFYPQIPVIL